MHFSSVKFVCIGLIMVCLLSSCGSNDNPPCRRVSAQEFMRPHTFKGIPTDEFIGSTRAGTSGMKRAFKQIWEMGWNYGWAVIWTPVSELPPDYLKTAHRKPNRPEKPVW